MLCCRHSSGPGVAERLLDSGQPGCSDRPLLKRHLGKRAAERSWASVRRAWLFLAEAQLPGDPPDPLAGLKAVVDDAKQADGRHRVLI